jgi:hypothetical protein
MLNWTISESADLKILFALSLAVLNQESDVPAVG